jgi:glucan phosphoethanolaminetransferase (alkaline phosphatase superfamily)
MDEEEIRGWVPSLALLATFLPIGLFITFFRLRRDVYLEQMPPVPVVAALLGGAVLVALLLFFAGPRVFRGRMGELLRTPTVLVSLLGVSVAGAASAYLLRDPAERLTPPPVSAELADRPNVILVMVDTLRADYLSCYGGPVETPGICSLAENV